MFKVVEHSANWDWDSIPVVVAEGIEDRADAKRLAAEQRRKHEEESIWDMDVWVE